MPFAPNAGTSSRRLAAVATLGASALCFAAQWPQANAADPLPGSASVYAWTIENIDVDALAARIKDHHDLYQKMRDESFAAYAKTHPEAHPYDAEVKKLIRLLNYLYVWDDYDREGLWYIADQQSRNVVNAGAKDPIVNLQSDISADVKTLSSDDAEAMVQKADTFAGTSYPLALKAWYYQIALDRLIATKADPDGHLFAELLPKWSRIYRDLLKSSLPNSLLYCIAYGMECCVSGDRPKLNQFNQEVDKAIADAAPGSPLQAEIDGRCLVDQAWISRSGGWASQVSSQQWAEFGDYLQKADTVLEAAYEKHPEESEISTIMLTVELGQGQGHDRMEQWFERAIKADPHNFEAYTAKFWYLQPRWYGSETDLVNFGVQNQELPEPPLRVLGAFGIALAQAADLDTDLYKRPEAWAPVEKNYRLILGRFPQSIFVRSAFAKHAADSGRWKIAKEQLDLLGDNWDRSTMTQSEHDRDVAMANAHPNEDGPAPLNAPITPLSPTTQPFSVWTVAMWILKFFLPL